MIIFWTSRWFIVADRLYRGGKPFSKSNLWLFFEHLVDILVLPLEDRGGLSLLRPLVCSSTKKKQMILRFQPWEQLSGILLFSSPSERNCKIAALPGLSYYRDWVSEDFLGPCYLRNAKKRQIQNYFFSNFPDFISMCTSCL